MEVLTSYPHHQLGADLASQNLYGGESSQACGNEVSRKKSTTYPQNDSVQDGDMALEHVASEVGVKVEKDSDAAEGTNSISASKSTKKLSEFTITK